MKKKMKFPDWTAPHMMLLSDGKDGKRPVWSEYTCDPDDTFSLRITVEISGGSCSYLAEESARVESSRQAAWRVALACAEQLWKDTSYLDYVVQFRLEDSNIGKEAVCVYQRFKPLG